MSHARCFGTTPAPGPRRLAPLCARRPLRPARRGPGSSASAFRVRSAGPLAPSACLVQSLSAGGARLSTSSCSRSRPRRPVPSATRDSSCAFSSVMVAAGQGGTPFVSDGAGESCRGGRAWRDPASDSSRAGGAWGSGPRGDSSGGPRGLCRRTRGAPWPPSPSAGCESESGCGSSSSRPGPEYRGRVLFDPLRRSARVGGGPSAPITPRTPVTPRARSFPRPSPQGPCLRVSRRPWSLEPQSAVTPEEPMEKGEAGVHTRPGPSPTESSRQVGARLVSRLVPLPRSRPWEPFRSVFYPLVLPWHSRDPRVLPD